MDQPTTELAVAESATRTARHWAQGATDRRLGREVDRLQRDHDNLGTEGLARLRTLRNAQGKRT